MLANEESIRRWRDGAKPLRSDAIDGAAKAALNALGDTESPGPDGVKAAAHAALMWLTPRVVSSEWVEAIIGAPLTRDRIAELDGAFLNVRPEFRLPEPQITVDVSPIHLGIAALVGAIAGMMILTPTTRFLLDMRDVGLFLGAPIGAFLMVVAIWHAAQSKWVRWSLMTALSVGAISEIWAIVNIRTVFRRLWTGTKGRGSILKRMGIYAAGFAVLIVVRARPRFDRSEYERLARSSIDAWLDTAILTLGFLLEETKEQADTQAEACLSELAREVLELCRVPPESLPVARDELLQSLKNMGFEAKELPHDAFRWEEEHRKRYDVFGHVEIGDDVIIEREPVVLQSVVREKGLVRKMRERN